MPPKEELFRPFENVFEGWLHRKKHVLEWEVRGVDLYFRPYGAAPELIWFRNNFLMWPDSRDSQEQATRMAFFFKQAYKSLAFYRLVPLDRMEGAPQRSWVVVGYKESGIIGPDMWQRANWRAQFDWTGDRLSFLSAPIGFFLESVADAIKTEPDEFQEALAWGQMDNEERFWSLVTWKRGDINEWTLLIGSALQIALSCPTFVSALVSRQPMLKRLLWYVFILRKPRFAFAPLQMSRKPFVPTPDSLLQLAQLAQQYFGAEINYERSRANVRGPFAAHLLAPRIQVSVEPPNYHELMVALDLWRNFGRKSGQLPQVEACLQQLLT